MQRFFRILYAYRVRKKGIEEKTFASNVRGVRTPKNRATIQKKATALENHSESKSSQADSHRELEENMVGDEGSKEDEQDDWQASVQCLATSFVTWHRFAKQGIVCKRSLVAMREIQGDINDSLPSQFTLLHSGSKCPNSTLIGRGRYAKVYACEGFAFKIAKLKRDRSWKDTSTLRCDLKELFFFHTLDHPNIVKPIQSQLVMEHGRISRVIHKLPKAVTSLADRIGHRMTIRMPKIAQIVAHTASALAYMHSRNIVHGDVTPGNILLCSDGAARLTDFSLTTFQSKGLELALGTLFWRPPEGMLDGKSDVWSLGVIMLDMLFNCVFTRDMLNAGDQTEATRAWAILDLSTVLWDRLGFPGTFTSIQCMDLIMRMVVLNPTQRSTMTDVLNHPFCKGHSPAPHFDLNHSRIRPLAFRSEVAALARRVETILKERGASFASENVRQACESFWSYLWKDTWDESEEFESVVYHISTLLDYRVFDVIQ